MKVTIVGPNSGNAPWPETFRVHGAGCRDIGRDARITFDASPWTVEVECQREVVGCVYGPEAGSYYEEAGGDNAYPGGLDQYLEGYIDTEFSFAPCVKLPRLPEEG